MNKKNETKQCSNSDILEISVGVFASIGAMLLTVSNWRHLWIVGMEMIGNAHLKRQ